MKVDQSSLGLRLEAALLLFTLTVTALYLMGSAQNFTEETLRALFIGIRWLSWLGMLVSVWGLVFWSRRRRRLFATLVLTLGFLSQFLFVLVWGAWIYPDGGMGLW